MLDRLPLPVAVVSFSLLSLSDCNEHRLGVTRLGPGFGTIAATTSAGNLALNCPDATCFNDAVAQGTTVTLTATPGGGNSFGGWLGDCQSVTSNTCTVEMGGRRQVYAAFVTGTPTGMKTITTRVVGPGTSTNSAAAAGSICTRVLPPSAPFSQLPASCKVTVPVGTPVRLRAIPNTGSDGAPLEFDRWIMPAQGNHTCAPAPNFPDCIITVSDNFIVTAAFKRFPVTVTVTGPGLGNVTGPGFNCGTGAGSCRQSIDQDATITLTATPDAGSVFTGWTETGGPACSGTGTCTMRVLTGRNVIAGFTDLFTLTVTVTRSSGPGGTVNVVPAANPLSPLIASCTTNNSPCTATVQSGTPLIVGATPNAGALYAWSGTCTMPPSGTPPPAPPPAWVGNTCLLPMPTGPMTVGVAYR